MAGPQSRTKSDREQALPGWAQDLLTDGVRSTPSPTFRQEITKAMRRVMMSAQRCGWGYSQVHAVLTDSDRHGLARQIATGRKGTRISVRQRSAFIAQHWADTQKVTSERPAWDRDQALHVIQHVRDNWHLTAHLPSDQRAILEVALDLAEGWGTTRVTLPVRYVSERIGKPRSTTGDLLQRMSHDGTWLSKVQSGNYATRRASLYLVAPSLLASLPPYGGATPPKSETPPKSDPPKSGKDGALAPHVVSLTAASPEVLTAVIRLLAAETASDDGLARTEDRVHLRVVGDSS